MRRIRISHLRTTKRNGGGRCSTGAMPRRTRVSQKKDIPHRTHSARLPPIAWTSLLEAFAAAELTTDLPDCDDEDECVLDPSWL